MNWAEKEIAFIGLGLIAGSMCRKINQFENRPRLTGSARSEATRARAREINLCDEIYDTNIEAIKNADIIVLSTPIGAIENIMREIAPHLKAGAIITDVASVKSAVIEAIEYQLPENVYFVPAHPLAGTEKSGPNAGFAELFENRACIITPISNSNKNAVALIRKLWEDLGAHVDIMDAEHHDLVLAVTSHLPHLIAYTMVGVADDLSRVTESEVIKYSASGFRDFTRIAASDPTMWRDVFLNNKQATLEMLTHFEGELSRIKNAIIENDGETLYDHFERTRAIRRGIIEIGQDTDLPNFGRNIVNINK